MMSNTLDITSLFKLSFNYLLEFVLNKNKNQESRIHRVQFYLHNLVIVTVTGIVIVGRNSILAIVVASGT